MTGRLSKSVGPADRVKRGLGTGEALAPTTATEAQELCAARSAARRGRLPRQFHNDPELAVEPWSLLLDT